MKPMRPILVSAVALLLAACAASSPEPTFSFADCAREDAARVVALSADSLEFSAPCIMVPADGPFTIRFTNRESTPHNVAVYDTADKGTAYLNGEHIGKDQSIDYAVEALPGGEYYFECAVHPVMNGTLFVLVEGVPSGS